MGKYCFMNIRPADDGHGMQPDCPNGVSFLLLADLREINWGIYEYTVDEDNDKWTPSCPVSVELEGLICSGKRYPPAMAIARYDVARLFGTDQPSQEEFAVAYAASIRTRLSQQQEAPYFLARARGAELFYLTLGEWYWVLRVAGDMGMVSWVSDDYFVYQNPVSDFDLTEAQIEQICDK